jgi:hypothetical protein
MLSAATPDPEKAQEWLTTYAAAHVGTEGVVAKGLDQRSRGWRPTGPAPVGHDLAAMTGDDQRWQLLREQ